MTITATEGNLVFQGPMKPIRSIEIDGEVIDFSKFSGVLSHVTFGTPFIIELGGFTLPDLAFILTPPGQRSTLTTSIRGIPDGTYDTRVINVDEKKMVYFGSKLWYKESTTFTLDNVVPGTRCEVFALTPDGKPMGANRGVTT